MTGCGRCSNCSAPRSVLPIEYTSCQLYIASLALQSDKCAHTADEVRPATTEPQHCGGHLADVPSLVCEEQCPYLSVQHCAYADNEHHMAQAAAEIWAAAAAPQLCGGHVADVPPAICEGAGRVGQGGRLGRPLLWRLHR